MKPDWSVVRILLIVVLAVVPAAAQIPLVSLRNASRPGRDLQTGDRYEIVITAAPQQAVSVRTSRQGRTDWGPIIGATDRTGRWSTAGQFGREDFGGWREIWTVEGKLASPVLQFEVKAPCVASGRRQSFFVSGPNLILSCDTTEGAQTFATPGWADAFRTPDGRLVNGRTGEQPQEQYYSELLEQFLGNGMGRTAIALQSSRGGLGDETAELIRKLIGVNALTEEETRNTLAILRTAFARPVSIQPTAKAPLRTLLLLRHLADITEPGTLRREIGETIAYFEAR
jgi:hypothetical protein